MSGGFYMSWTRAQSAPSFSEDYHKCDVLGNVDHLDCLRLSGGQ